MTRSDLSPEAVTAFAAEVKVGLLATLDRKSRPHLSLITTLQARSPSQLMWGQFCEGLSKSHVLDDPRTAFLVMSLSRDLWRGQALWTHRVTEGEDYVRFNQLSLFRYNSYFGIHTVHSMDVESCSDKERLPLPGMIAGSLPLLAGARLRGIWPCRAPDEPRLNEWTRKHLSRIDTLKFLAYVSENGYPAIVPGIPAMPCSSSQIRIAPTVHRGEILAIPRGAQVALFALNLEMESVLIRGAYSPPDGARLTGGIEVEWVYNSMPPLPGQVYPPEPLRPVRDFS
jgi:hypothetical protein